jgi:RHS repeat-associated protein
VVAIDEKYIPRKAGNPGPQNPTVAWQGKQGYQFEQPLGLQYVRQRWYDPTTRQFISPDPLGLPDATVPRGIESGQVSGGDVNLFRYAGNNPINRNDPGGKASNAISADMLTALMLSEAAIQLQANSPRSGALTSGYIHELQSADMDILHALEQSSASSVPFSPQHPAISQATQWALAAFGSSMQNVLHGMQQSYTPLTTAQLHTDYLWAHQHEVQIPTLVAKLRRDLAEVQTTEQFLKLRMLAGGANSTLPDGMAYVHATEALLMAAIGFVGHRWSAYQNQQNAFQGGYFRAREQNIQGLIMAMRMIPGGEEAWDILQNHPGYAAGWAALDVVGLGGEELVTHGMTLLGRGLSTSVRVALQPIFGAIGGLEILPYRQRLTLGVRLSRLFLTRTRGYVAVEESPIMAALLRCFPALRDWDWEQGHVFIQQRWFREDGPNAWYKVRQEIEGLRRAGNAGWNLLPMPRWLNRYLAVHPNAAMGFGLGVPVAGGASVAGSWYLGRYIHYHIFDGR